MLQVTVQVKDHEYPIYIGASLFPDSDKFAPYLCSDQVLVVSNETVAPLYLDAIEQSLGSAKVTSYLMPDGELYKSFSTFQAIMDCLIKNRFRRNATIIALGGGVVGDITGFASACYQRGVPFIQVPTTLLAMVDSSVGGKTAINHPDAKNMIGAF